MTTIFKWKIQSSLIEIMFLNNYFSKTFSLPAYLFEVNEFMIIILVRLRHHCKTSAYVENSEPLESTTL